MVPMVLVSLAIALSLTFSTRAHATEITYDSHGFRIDGTYRLLRGGTVQWFRIPEEQWEDRLRRFKAAGFNTVDLYVPWNVVEPQEGQFNFTEPNLKRFLQLIQSLNLYAYFRPGPYITNEMDSGGIPSWVIGKSTKTQRRADGRPVLRDNDPDYLALVGRYFDAVNQIVRPFLATRGGPVILYALENEYNYFENFVKLEKLFTYEGRPERPLGYTTDTSGYFTALRDLARGDGIDVPLTTCPGHNILGTGDVPGIIPMPNLYRKTELEKHVHFDLAEMHNPEAHNGVYVDMPSGITEADRTPTRMKRVFMAGMDAFFAFNVVGMYQEGYRNAMSITDLATDQLLRPNSGNSFAKVGYFHNVIDFFGPISSAGALREKFYGFRRANMFLDAFEKFMAPVKEAQVSGGLALANQKSTDPRTLDPRVRVHNPEIGANEPWGKRHYWLDANGTYFLQILNENTNPVTLKRNAIEVDGFMFPQHTNMVLQPEPDPGPAHFNTPDDLFNATILPYRVPLSESVTWHYTTSETLTLRSFDSETLLVVYGPKGTQGEMRFTFNGRPYVINRRTPGIQLHETARNGLTFSYPHSDGEQVAFRGPDGKQYRVLILSRHTAGRTWFLKTKQGHKERELVVMGLDYIDNPDDIDNMTFEFSDVHQTRDVTVMSGQPWIFDGLSQTKPWNHATGLAQYRFTGSFAFPSENNQEPMRVLTFDEGTAIRDGAEALPEFDTSTWMSWEGRPRPFEELGITTGHAWYRTTFDLESTRMPTHTDLYVEHASDFIGIYVNGHYLTTLSPLGTEIFGAHKHPRYQFSGINDWLVPGRNVIAFRVETWGHGSFMFPRGKVTVGNAQIPAVGFDALKGLYGHADLTLYYNNNSTSQPARMNLSTWQARPLTGGELSGWHKQEANTDTWKPITFPLRLNPGENLWVQTRFQTADLPDPRKFNAPLTFALKGEQIKATLFLNNRLIGRWLSDTDWLRRGSWMESVRDPWMEFSPDHFPFALERLRRDGEANVLTLLLEDTSHNAGATPGVSGQLDQLSIIYNQDRWSNSANRHRIPERAFSFRSIKTPVAARAEPRFWGWLRSHFAYSAR